MADVLKVVDSVASSPTTRLDLNDGATWSVVSFDPGNAKVRRASAANAMRDGGFVSSSTRDFREITARLSLVAASEDSGATQLQTLARELDRAANYLMWHPTGLTKPVFFRFYRSDIEQVDVNDGQTSHRYIQVRFLADPLGIGVRETLGPFTVNNDPAAGSNGCYVDLTGVIGDVATPCTILDTTAWRTYGLLAMRQHGTPSDMVWFTQAESVTLGTDTTNPGGAADAAMSGAGTTNYARTSFGTNTNMVPRVTWETSSSITTTAQRTAMRGNFRVLAAIRRSGTTSTITSRVSLSWSGGAAYNGSTVTMPATTTRTIVDLGVFALTPVPTRLPYQSSDAPATSYPNIQIAAARSGGSDTIDWDCIFLVPADESTLSWGVDEAQDTGLDMFVDGYQDAIYVISGSPYSGGIIDVTREQPNIVGGWPMLVPNQTNRLFVFMGASLFTSPVADTNALTVDYFPRYLYVRPSAT